MALFGRRAGSAPLTTGERIGWALIFSFGMVLVLVYGTYLVWTLIL